MRNRVSSIRAIGARFACVVINILAACAHPTAATSSQSLGGRGAIVEVRSDTFDDCVIYLIRSGTPIPLGVAPGLSRRAFGIGPGELGDGVAIVLGAG